MPGDVFTPTLLPGDNDGGDPVVGGIRSGRGAILGVHFATGDPSFGGVWANASLSVSAMMRFISCLKISLSCFHQKKKRRGETYLITGPIGFHPDGCFKGISIGGDPGGTTSGGETPSIVNRSSGMLRDIGMGRGLSGVDFCRAISDRSLAGWVREPS